MVTGESGSDEDREREQLLRRATEVRGSITRAQDRYGAIMDAFKTTEEITLGMPSKQVCPSMTVELHLHELSPVCRNPHTVSWVKLP